MRWIPGPRSQVPRSRVSESGSNFYTMPFQSSFNRFEFWKSVHLEIRKGVTKERIQLNKERKGCIYSPEIIRKPEGIVKDQWYNRLTNSNYSMKKTPFPHDNFWFFFPTDNFWFFSNTRILIWTPSRLFIISNFFLLTCTEIEDLNTNILISKFQ